MYKRRLIVFLALMGGLTLLAVARLAQLQLVRGAEYRRQAGGMLTYGQLLPTARGQLLDRKGRVLALDEACYDFCLDYRMLTCEGQGAAPGATPTTFWGRFLRLLGQDRTRRARQTEQEKWVRRQVRALARAELAALGKTATPEQAAAINRRAERTFQERLGKTWELAEQLTGVSRNEMARAAESAIRRVETIRATVGGPILEESQPQAIVGGLDEATALALRQHLDEMVGASVRPSFRRRYPYGPTACHVLGHVGPITAEEPRLVRPHPGMSLAEMTDGYLPGDLIGQGGVEQSCEDLLRGRRGLRSVHRLGSTAEETPAVPGTDVHLTLDLDLQNALAEALGRPGAVVVLDVPTGEVLALVSLPAYDLNEYRRQFEQFAQDTADLPLLNRAVSVRYPPGSTMKPIAALAALSEGAITPQTTFTCRGYLHTPGEFRCDAHSGHGTLDLLPAIERSCNVYFYNVGERLGVKRMVDWLGEFGFADRPGTGLPEELPALLPPTDQPPARTVGEARFLAIGQGPVAATPLHVANAMATIARGGEFIPPVLVSERAESSGRRALKLSAEHLDVVRHGMELVVNSPNGTAYKYVHDPENDICGKTGTAETAPRRIDSNHDGRIDSRDEIVRKGDTAWFAGFAPYRNPQIAFAVVVEYSEFHGGPACGPIARKLVRLCRELGYVSP